MKFFRFAMLSTLGYHTGGGQVKGGLQETFDNRRPARISVISRKEHNLKVRARMQNMMLVFHGLK